MSKQSASSADHTRQRDALPPGFVLCPARSGSTLLRLILNSHPEVACPPETNLGDAFTALYFSVAALSERDGSDSETSSALAERRQAICREVARALLGEYARARAKRVWVDKSLSSVYQADLLADVYPDARFICLYRQCTDTILSLREACGWSYDGFGVLPFFKAEPTANLVQALALYWAERVERMQAFELAHPDQTLRLRYEDLVAGPEKVVNELFVFLGVNSDADAITSALSFRTDASPVMPGDLKVRFSQGINDNSVGRGWSVPVDLLSPDLRDHVDRLSQNLDYPALPDLKQLTTASAAQLTAAGPGNGRQSEIGQILHERATRHSGGEAAQLNGASSVSLLKLVLTDQPEPWLIDLESSHVEMRDGAADWVALTDSGTLMSLISGQVNPGTAMKNATLKVVSNSEHKPDDYLDCVAALVALLRG